MRQSRTSQQNVEDQPRLSRQLILDTAIGLVQREGESALSMRRIAQELDVWPMSLYRYFHDKQALLEALAEANAAWQALVDYLAGSAMADTEQFEYGLDLMLTALQPRAGSEPRAGLAR